MKKHNIILFSTYRIDNKDDLFCQGAYQELLGKREQAQVPSSTCPSTDYNSIRELIRANKEAEDALQLELCRNNVEDNDLVVMTIVESWMKGETQDDKPSIIKDDSFRASCEAYFEANMETSDDTGESNSESVFSINDFNDILLKPACNIDLNGRTMKDRLSIYELAPRAQSMLDNENYYVYAVWALKTPASEENEQKWIDALMYEIINLQDIRQDDDYNVILALHENDLSSTVGSPFKCIKYDEPVTYLIKKDNKSFSKPFSVSIVVFQHTDKQMDVLDSSAASSNKDVFDAVMKNISGDCYRIMKDKDGRNEIKQNYDTI